MSFTVRNKTTGPAVNVDIPDLGITIEASSDRDLRNENPTDIAKSTDLLTAISAGDIVVIDPFDGSTELSIADSTATVNSANDTHWRLGAGARFGDISDIDITGASVGDVLTLGGGGNWADTSPSALTITNIEDADGDTLIQLEESADDDTIRFDVGDTPAGYGAVTDIFVLSSADWSVNMGTADTAATPGATIDLRAGTGNTSGNGGGAALRGGNSGTTGNAGAVSLSGGTGGATSGDGGGITITGGSAQGGNSPGGDISMTAGEGFGSGRGGDFDFVAGGGGDTGKGGDAAVTAGGGGATSGNGGELNLVAGSANGGGDGGDVIITSGAGFGGGSDGNILFDFGNVGIGASISSPSAKLEVAGGTGNLLSGDFHASITSSIRTRSETGQTLQMSAGTIGTALSSSSFITFHTDSDNNLGTASNERMRIDAAGNVGIGFASPTYRVEAHRSDNRLARFVNTTPSNAVGAIVTIANASGIALSASNILGELIFQGSTGASTFGDGATIKAAVAENWAVGTQGTDLEFYTVATGGSTTLVKRMTVTADGNVGINDTNPLEKLSVDGNIAVTGDIISEGITWTSRTSAADNGWRSVTYGNGLFVAVAISGAGDRVMTSPDGINWTLRISAADNAWFGVTYGNGLFVAVANSGTGDRVMTSPDGITWTSRTSAADNGWLGVTYGNGLFVAVASSGSGGDRVMTSPDGITWTIRTSAADNGWSEVTYGNGLFVAVANTGTGDRIMTSPDGITWTSRTSAADNQWLGVTYGNGLFVGVSQSGSGNRVMTSGKQEDNVLSHNNLFQGGININGNIILDSLSWPSVDGTNGQVLTTDGSGILSFTTPGGGDVVGPASATDDALARFNGVTGKLIQNSLATLSDAGRLSLSSTADDTVVLIQSGTLVTDFAGIRFKTNSAGSPSTELWQVFQRDADFFIGQHTVGDYVIIEKDTGNVGIGAGISSPSAKLEVAGGTGDVLVGEFHAGTTSSIRIRSEAGETLQALVGTNGAVISSSTFIGFATNSDNDLNFPTNERMRLDGSTLTLRSHPFELRFEESGGSNYVGFVGPTPITSNVIWTLPATDSTGTQALVSDGSGVLSFVDLGGSAAAFDVYDNAGGQTFTTGTITINLDTIRKDSGGGAFTLATDEVTVNNTDTYAITYRASIDIDTGSTRSTCRSWLERNAVEVDGTSGFTYNRNTTSGHNTATVTVILDLTAGDVLRVRANRFSGPDTLVTLVDGSSLTIYALATAGATGATGATGSGSTITVEDEGIIVTGGPHDTLNFTGGSVTVTDAGAGTANITISAAVVQARRSTLFDVPTAWTDVTLDNTDIETNTAIVEHDNTFTDRITLVPTGTYRVDYKVDTESPEQLNQMCRLQGRVRVNDTTVIPGSFSQTNIVNDSSLDSFEMNDQQLVGFFTYVGTASDFLTLQLQIVNLGGSSMNIDTQNVTLMVTHLGA